MEATAKITSKGQITLPKAVRTALGVREGDTLIFRIDGHRAVVARTRDLLDLAGVVSVPVELRGVPWTEVRRRAWQARGEEVAG
jgi:AbrB family looped-hinge helix DNA binding protein